MALTTAGLTCALPVLVGLGWSGASVVEVENLRSANEALRLENESYRDATGELTSQIASLQTALVQLGEQGALDANTRAQIAVINRVRGVGGPVTVSVPPAPPIRRVPEAAPETTFGILRDLLGSIESRLTSVRSQVDSQQTMARATPSVWPVSGWLSSLYGNRKDPFTGLPDFHPAIDIATERGKEVQATADGIVESVGYLGNYGNQILISHGFGVATRYGHLSGFNVRQGQKVSKRDVIGYVGSTGRATSPHLHYEIIINGRTINPLRLLTSNR